MGWSAQQVGLGFGGLMFKELEVLAAQVGYRFAEAIQVHGKWYVVLDDEDGEI